LKHHEISTPELLAPAGSIEAFHAAINAGADAIYCGLEDFNARLRAKNFSIKTLSHLIPLAHEKDVKVYITLNTIIKNSETEQALHTLYQLYQLHVDAVIIADIGLVHLSREYFPNLVLHGSTQMTIHNTPGIQAATRLGLKRVVLSRELTASEISGISKQSPIELEVFIHGALCYSISGLCLASSFFGGSSGNRGRCTQVCRRKFTYNKTDAYSFSPDDLCAAEFITSLADNHVASLKIEGRMKSAEYVHKVVTTYRKLLDTATDISTAQQELSTDFGRPKTSFFLKGKDQRGLIKASRPSGTGMYIGEVIECDMKSVTINSTTLLKSGDRIRIHPVSGFDGISATIKTCEKSKHGITCIVNSDVACSKGDVVYHTGTNKGYSAPKDFASTGENLHIHQFFKNARSIVQKQSTTNNHSSGSRAKLWCKIDNIGWMEPLRSSPCQHLLAALDCTELEKLLSNESLLKPWRSRLVPCLPPFISPENLRNWNALIIESQKEGITTWCCGNIGQTMLFHNKCTLIADSFIPVLNNFAWDTLKKVGFSMFTYSLEDEYLNLRNHIHSDGIVCLYSHVPLFVSRIRPAVRLNTTTTDPFQNRLRSYVKNDLYYTITEKPLCLTGKKNKLSEEGISHFSIDLSGMKPNQEKLWEILSYYKESAKIPDSTLFNFKAGLK
jgi:putative protease